YLTRLWSPGERTLLQGIRKLPPGHMLAASASGVEVRRWAPDPATLRPPPRRLPVHDIALELQELIDQVIADQCVSDVSVGAFLSGGVDSSAVVAGMVASGNPPAKTYCIGFSGCGMVEEGFSDDLAHAQHVAKHLGVALSEIRVAPPSAEDLAGMVH